MITYQKRDGIRGGLLAGMAAGMVLMGSGGTALGAGILLDDHFDDGTGAAGNPVGWSALPFGGGGTVTESPSSSSNVVVDDPREVGGGGPTGIMSSIVISTTEITEMTVDIESFDGTSAEAGTFLGYITPTFNHFFVVSLQRPGPTDDYFVRVIAGPPGDSANERRYDAGDVSWTGTVPVQVLFSFDQDSFRVSLSGGITLDTGDVPYANNFVDENDVVDPTFNPTTGLGTSVNAAIVSSSEGNDLETSVLTVDRITVEGIAVPEPSAVTLLGGVLLLAGMRRRRG